MSRLKVVFSIGAMHGGGSERQLVSLLKHLDRDRFEPHLYLVYRSGPLLQEVPADVKITSFDQRCRATGVYFPGLMHRRRVADMSRYLREVRADVVYDRTFLMTLIAADAAQAAGVPNVSTVVTDPSLGFAPVAGKFQSFNRRALRKLYSRSKRVLANSVGAARSAESFYGLKSDLVGVHYNGVDLQHVRSIAEQPIDVPWWTETNQTTRRIVTAGRLSREKGFQHLIAAFARLKRESDFDLRLAILGEGVFRSELEQQIAGLALQNEVKLLGFRRDACAWYKLADVFVLPSLLEGMPNVLLEAMAVETPVVSTDCPSGPAEVLRHGDFGTLVPVGCSESLESAVRECLVDDDTSRLTSARQWVESEFSIETATRKLEQILLQVVE